MPRSQGQHLPSELLGIAGLNPAAAYDSPPRQFMISSHLSQALVVKGATPRRFITGMERRFGEATFSVRMPRNGEVIAVVPKYSLTQGERPLSYNPMTSILFEDIETGTIDVLQLPSYHCTHHHFGFTFKLTQSGQRLTRGTAIAKDTLLATSPSVDARGNYKLGVELNTAFMSVPGVLEDGMIISESVRAKFTSQGFESRTESWGKSRFPLNLYGTKDVYKVHPDLGERVNDEGLLMAFREYDRLLGGVLMAEDTLKEPDRSFDRLVYAVPKAKVTDVTAYTSSQVIRHTPPSMNVQAERYHTLQKNYYKEIIRVAKEHARKNHSQFKPPLHRLIVEGLQFNDDLGKMRPKLEYNSQSLDEWRVIVSFEYEVVPSVSSKISDLHG